MEVILREEIDNLGTRGQVVKVKEGYARNFLLPRRLAVPATDANKKIVEQERQAWLKKEAKAAAEAAELAKMVEAVSITIKAKFGDNGQLFGSVTAQDIVNALAAQSYTIDRKKVELKEPIKHLGDFKVPVKLHREVTAKVTVHVVGEGGETAASVAAAAAPAPVAEPAEEKVAE
ncbi:MAG: 50S ribosomal protein L9 [Bryobacteraceae bacterium]|jgi:large subunit ribosomal protein L9|nr:50S ribosomal protein L9 [Bryobacteraceae bacterium]